MQHPSDHDLVLHVLALKEDPDLLEHLEQCEECTGRLHSFTQAIEKVGQRAVPTLTGEEVEDVFATAWRSSRRPETRPRAFPSLWRWILQPAALFTCGLLAGYLAFATRQPLTLPPTPSSPVEVVQVSNPIPAPEPPITTVTPMPTGVASIPAATPVPDKPSGKDFWHMAGLRNVKLTPTVRYEDGKVVRGARLEGETLNGAMVVMAF